MFNRSAAQLVSTRSQAKTKVLSNENKGPVDAKMVLMSKQDGKTQAGARKRRALGDVSNSHIPAATKTTKTVKTNQTKVPKATISKRQVGTAEVLQVEKENVVDETKRQKIVETAPKWTDLDAADIEDPVMVSEYVQEIFDYLREQELRLLPDPNYMLKQKDLQWKMRNILIDWLVEVHHKFKLLPETLFLTVNIIDRFLSRRAISQGKLQLVGVTSMFIAAKYEEVFAPSINQFVYITDGGYTYEEIVKAERFILATLNFDLQYPNPLNYLRRISKADSYDITTRTMGKYLMEITLLDEVFLSCPPSLIAASAMYVARHVRGISEWDHTMEHYAGYAESDLENCVVKMVNYLHRDSSCDSVPKKYASEKNYCVSVLVQNWMNVCVEERNFDMPWI